MGEVVEKITLENSLDVGNVKRGLIKEADIHRLNVEAVVDTGAMEELVITEEACKRLGLFITREEEAILPGGLITSSKITEGVTVRWKDRDIITEAVVLPGQSEILLGVIPLEKLRLRVNPVDQCLESLPLKQSWRPIRTFMPFNKGLKHGRQTS